jgi:hypothetical protein
MRSSVFQAFLEQQYIDGMALAAASDLLDLTPISGSPPDRYLADFRCIGLVKDADGVHRADRFLIQIAFPHTYLDDVDPSSVLTLIAPDNVYHPNIRAPWICPGHLHPGTPLVDVLWTLFEILTFHRLTTDETNALRHEACSWAREHRDLFPLDPRPLRRRLAGARPPTETLP